jgi:hypothetical protein
LKILLDEGVPKVIQQRLNRLSISNVEDMGWRGITNGALLDLMVAGQFQILITADKNHPFQQNLKKRQLSAIIIPAKRCSDGRPVVAEDRAGACHHRTRGIDRIDPGLN